MPRVLLGDRMRRRGRGSAAALLLALAAGCTSDAPSAGRDRAQSPTGTAPVSAPPPSADGSASPATAPPASSATAVASAAGAQRRAGDRIELFHGARVVVPAGWKYDDGNDGGTGCLDAVTLEACSVRLVNPAAIRRDGGEVDEPDGESDFGWYLGTDVPPCFELAPQRYDRGDADRPLLSSRIVERGMRPLGSRSAVFRTYALSCQGRELGTARLWLLPTSRLAVVALDTFGTTPPAEVDRVVALLDVEGYRA